MKPQWTQARRFEYIRYEKWQGMAKITINRPVLHNAFRRQTAIHVNNHRPGASSAIWKAKR